MNKEQVYDEKINPLMMQIVDICKENGIALIANFAIPNETDKDLQVITNLPDEKGEFPHNHVRALNAIRPSASGFSMIKSTDADGNVTVTAII